MNITESFLNFALLGAEWVMWLLVVLSVISIAVMVERWFFYRSHRVDVDGVRAGLSAALAKLHQSSILALSVLAGRFVQSNNYAAKDKV